VFYRRVTRIVSTFEGVDIRYIVDVWCSWSLMLSPPRQSTRRLLIASRWCADCDLTRHGQHRGLPYGVSVGLLN